MKTVIAMKPADQKGLAVVRAALIRAKGEIAGHPVDDLAEQLYGRDSAPVRLTKAAVGSGRYSDIGGSERSVAEFFEAVREASVLGRMRFRRVGMRVRTMFPSTPIAAAWVQPGDAVPVGKTLWADDTLEPKKVAALTVATRESVDAAIGGDPLAEAGIRNDMVRAVAAAISAALLDPSNAGSDALPASITNGVSGIGAGGDPLADIKSLVENFTGDLATSAFAMRPHVAASLAGADFPDLTLTGGSIWGIPVAVSRHAPDDTIVLADGAGIALAEGDIGIAVSRQASIEMDTEPSMSGDSPVVESNVVSLWQTNSVGFLADLAISWQKVRSSSVAMLTGIAYRPFVT